MILSDNCFMDHPKLHVNFPLLFLQESLSLLGTPAGASVRYEAWHVACKGHGCEQTFDYIFP